MQQKAKIPPGSFPSENILVVMNKHKEKPKDMFNKQDVTVYLTYIKILKNLNILNFRLHIPEAIFKYFENGFWNVKLKL